MTFNLILEQNFNEPLDPAIWRIYGAGGRTSRSFYGPNTTVANGNLQLRGTPDTLDADPLAVNLSAGIEVRPAYFLQKGGRVEIRAKVAGGRNTRGRATNYGWDSYGGLFPGAGGGSFEIDMIEVRGAKLNEVVLTQHYKERGLPKALSHFAAGTTWHSEFHTFAIEITGPNGIYPGELAYFVDNVERAREALLFDLVDGKFALGYIDGECGKWIDCPANGPSKGFPEQVPGVFEIDYVKIYSYTPDVYVDPGGGDVDPLPRVDPYPLNLQVKSYVNKLLALCDTKIAANAPKSSDPPEIAADKIETIAYFNKVRDHTEDYYRLG